MLETLTSVCPQALWLVGLIPLCPCRPDLHYMLPPSVRLPKVKRLIEQQGYFVVHWSVFASERELSRGGSPYCDDGFSALSGEWGRAAGTGVRDWL